MTWTPTAANINALPPPVRKYIHDLETLADPAGIVQENVLGRDTIKALEAWVNDLQAGLYINCVYCGHRYGPGETETPAAALTAHIETCPKHPLSTLRAAAIRYRAAASEISCRLADEWQGEDLDETCLEDLRAFSEADAALAKALAQEPGE